MTLHLNSAVMITLSAVLLLCFAHIPLSSANNPEIVDLRFLHGSDVQVGSNVSLSCRIRNVSFPNYMLHFHKQSVQVVNGSVVKTWQELSQNINTDYQGLSINYWIVEHGADMEYILNIPHVYSGFSGNYSCGVSQAATNFLINRTAFLNIYEEPTSVQLYISNQTVVANSTQVFNFTSLHHLKCAVNGSNPAAIIQIFHGNQDLTPHAHFTFGNLTYGPPPNSMYPFLAPLTRATNATIDKWHVDVTYQGVPVVCLARASPNALPHQAQFTPVIADGPPRFACQDVFHLPMTTDIPDEFDIRCEFWAKPPITDAAFGCETTAICRDISGFPIHAWQPKPDTVYSLYVESRDNPHNLSAITKGVLIMKIRLPRNALAGRAYLFKATNTQGTALHKVTLSATAGGVVQAIVSMATIFGSLLALVACQMTY